MSFSYHFPDHNHISMDETVCLKASFKMYFLAFISFKDL